MTDSDTIELTGAAHVLAVHNLERSRNFYRDALGFEVLDVTAPGWCFMRQGACRLQLGECPDALPAADTGDHAYFAYFYAANASGLFKRAQAAGAEILKPLTDEDWGMREFALRTPDGHRVMIGEALRSAD